MKRLLFSLVTVALCGGCATQPYDHEGLRATREMTDMDGRPIAPYGGGLSLGVGVGAWWHHGGVGIGLGTGW